MGNQFDLKRAIAARRHIREFAEEYSSKCGKDPSWIVKDIIAAKKINHISLGEYEWTGYDTLSDAQKRSISTLWTRAEFRKAYTDRRYICILMNKYIFSKVFADYFGRACIQTRGADERALRALAGDTGRIVYKPGCKGQGKGVRVLPCANDAEAREALAYIQSCGEGVIEEYIVQHDVLARLNPGAVSIVRFYTVCAPSGAYLFAPVLTTAITKEISNGCQDALTAMIDIKTGEVITHAVDQNNNTDHACHPITGTAFKGLALPHWDATIDMMRRAVPLASRISNIGWDIALTESGPLIIEANTIPGFNTAQYRGFSALTDGYGYQPLFDELNGRPYEHDSRYDRVILRLD